MPERDHNPHKRRLYLPIVAANGSGHVPDGADAATALAATHVARSVGCAQTVAPAGRRPEWLRVKAKMGPNYRDLKQLMRSQSLHTVCEEAGCPNIFECWEDREATFLILGDRCTRRCGFCDVMTAKPFDVDEEEPRKIAETVKAMGLRYVVLTGVARDDLPDGGARIWAECIRAVRDAVPGIGREILPTDFKGGERDIATVIAAEPNVFAHNLETVRRLHDRIRPAFGYDRSIDVLRIAKRLRPEQVTKSNLILGMGERPDEVPQAMRDLRAADCDLLTIGQYLRPTAHHLPVDRWVTPDEFVGHARFGMDELGFVHVEAG